MAKANHSKRQRPQNAAIRRRRSMLIRFAEQRSRRELERWRRHKST